MNKLVLSVLGIHLLLVGCSTTSNAPLAENKVGTLKHEQQISIQHGTVIAVKQVSVLEGNSNVGRRVGRTTGSIAGSLVGSGYGSLATSIVGGLMGGSLGSSADKEIRKKPGLEITLKLADGKKVIVTQLATHEFKVGDKVKLIIQDNKAKVVSI